MVFQRPRAPRPAIPAAPARARVESGDPLARLRAEQPEPLAPLAPAATRDDDVLIAAARAGDLESFNLLVLRHERVMFNVCLRLLRDPAAAEDATQDAFIRAWSNLGSFRGGSGKAWLLKIAVNRCYDLLRTRARQPASSLDSAALELEPVWSSQSDTVAPEVRALQGELGIYLERALTALPPDQRATVILADIHGCSHEEVAEITSAARGTVKSRLSRARARLRQTLTDQPGASELFDRVVRLYEEPGQQPAPEPPVASASVVEPDTING